MAIKAFEGNPHDSKTIEPLLQQMFSEHQELPKTLVYDRRDRDAKEVIGVKVITPGKPKESNTAYKRKKKRYPFQRRAGIKPVFGHLKKEYRMQDNFLSSNDSAAINAMMAATAWNLKKFMKELVKKRGKSLFVLIYMHFLEAEYSEKFVAL